MSDYYNDIQEIVSFLGCLDSDEGTSSKYDACVAAFTEPTGEQYLDERASAVLERLNRDALMEAAFRRLSAF